MDSIDALGPTPERRAAFSRELLAETQDDELQSIVEAAAQSLRTPISMVTLVLDHVQFFKAHYGLPLDMAASRGTSRDVSFCQFVVRDGKVFEVSDAAADHRVPQHLVKEYGIQSYLGVPIHAQDTVAGSLCVMDNKPRVFSDHERQELAKLAKRVDERLAKLTESRRQARLSLLEKTSVPALAELREVLTPARAATEAGLVAAAALSSFHRLASHVISGGSSPPKAMERSLKTAAKALEECENAFFDIESSLGDAEDSLLALQHLTSPSHSTRLSEVLIAGQELARHSVRPVGGASLPDLTFDPQIYSPRALSVSLFAASLASVAAHLDSRGASGGIEIELNDCGSTAEVTLTAKELPTQELEQIASELGHLLGEESTVSLQGSDGALRLTFQVVRPLGSS
jgi:hypothetical protein